MAGGEGAGRRTSEWACGEDLERAARYVHAVRTAPTRAVQVRAAASREGLAAVRSLLRDLPVHLVALSDAPAGAEMRAWFRPDRRLPFNRAPIAVLPLPTTSAEYLRGRARQALRTNLTRAAAAGLVCASVGSARDLRRISAAVAARRGTTGEEMVRAELVPGPQRRFSVAYDAVGDPVALSHAIVDGDRAGLILMVTAVGHAQATLVRYALHADLVGGLIGQGVTSLTVGGSMLLTSEGTRYFQRRTGFVPVRVRMEEPGAGYSKRTAITATSSRPSRVPATAASQSSRGPASTGAADSRAHSSAIPLSRSEPGRSMSPSV